MKKWTFSEVERRAVIDLLRTHGVTRTAQFLGTGARTIDQIIARLPVSRTKLRNVRLGLERGQG